jgi:acetate kinase
VAILRALALNAGSSTLKAALYELEPAARLADPAAPRWRRSVEWDPTDRDDAAADLLAHIPGEVDVVGHRIVHGGERFRRPQRVTHGAKAAIGALAEWAPLHNAAALRAIAAAERFTGRATPHVAVFDTAFHVDLPAGARTFAGPRDWLERGLRRFGFHGISHEYAAHRAARLIGRPLGELRLITCHLGSGCSLAAVRDGRSVDTTMGFTPLDGLVMGTRSGTLDPGLILHLLRQPGASVETLDALLNERSGLRGLSGGSGDLREVLEARAAGDAAADLAFEVYVHRLRSQIGAMLGALGGLDALVFTAGVGENSAAVREAALAPFEFLGVRLDPERNATAEPDADVTAAGGAVRVLVIRAREEWAIARAAADVARGEAAEAEYAADARLR